MEKISPVKAPLLSWYSKPFYRSVAQDWGGAAFGYLFVLLAVLWLVIVAKYQVAINIMVDKYLPPIMEQLPSVSLANGELIVDGEMPIVIKDPDTKLNLIWIDTKDGATGPPASENFSVVVTRQGMTVKNQGAGGRSEYIPFKSQNDFTFGDQERATVDSIAKSLKQWFWITYFFFVPVGFVFCVIQVLLYALFGMVYRGLTNAELTYGQLIRLSVAAITPCLIIDTILKVFDLMNPLWGLLAALIAMAYLYYGVKANCPEKLQEANAS